MNDRRKQIENAINNIPDIDRWDYDITLNEKNKCYNIVFAMKNKYGHNQQKVISIKDDDNPYSVFKKFYSGTIRTKRSIIDVVGRLIGIMDNVNDQFDVVDGKVVASKSNELKDIFSRFITHIKYFESNPLPEDKLLEMAEKIDKLKSLIKEMDLVVE